MEKRLDDLQKRLQSSINIPWCKTFSNELNHLSTNLSNTLPIYRTRITRDQLLTSIKYIQELEINTKTNDLYRRALINYLLLLSIHTHKLICGVFLDRMDKVKKHANFWKNYESSPLSIIEQIKTTFWFDPIRDDIRTNEKVKFLNRQQDTLANIIGRLAYTITNLEQQEQINLDLIMNYTNDLHKIIYDGTAVNYNSHSDLLDVIELYSQILNYFDEFHLRWKEKIHMYYQPTHLKRYFPYYICSTVIGVYTIYKIYSNKNQILDYIYTSYDSLKFFVNEHLIIPIKTIYTSTFESNASENAYENLQLNYTNSKKILEEMLEEYGRQHADVLAQINNTNTEEFLSTLSQRARDEDMNIVMKYYQQELNTPIRSAVVGDLIKGILIQVQKVKVDGEGLVLQIDQLMRQNQINFSLLATIPAILLITFLTISTKNIIANRLIKQRKFDLTTIRQNIICKLREIEQILIFNNEIPALMFNNQELIIAEKNPEEQDNQQITPMTYHTYGNLLSHIFQLKFFTNQLKSKRMLSKEFNDDINLLTYTQLTVRQKLLIIQQINHSYSFLVHG